LYTIADLLIRRFLGRRRRHAKSAEQSGLAIAAGSLIDNVPEGIVIGIGAIGGPVSPALLAAVCLSNLPEALASAARMHAAGHRAPFILGVWSAIGTRGFIAGVLPNTPQNMVRWLRHPQAVSPKSAMPDLGVTEPDARDIAAYLSTLR
jgi:zinc transporter ZupT